MRTLRSRLVQERVSVEHRHEGPSGLTRALALQLLVGLPARKGQGPSRAVTAQGAIKEAALEEVV